MSLSTNPIDELTERPNDKFGRFLYDTAYILAILGGLILVIVILINFVSILSRIIFLNPLVGDFELVEIGSAIAISSFLPLCHLKKGNVIVDFITAKLNFKKVAFLDCISSIMYGLLALFFTWRMFFGARDITGSHPVIKIVPAQPTNNIAKPIGTLNAKSEKRIGKAKMPRIYFSMINF